MRNSVMNQKAGVGEPWLESLYAAHSERVFRAAYRVTGNASDAEDVLQTVFLRLLKQGHAAESMDGPASYLYRAGTNAALDLLRARKSAAQIAIEDTPPSRRELSIAAIKPEQAQFAERLRGAIAKLHETAAHMFTLRYFDGLENSEIARLLETTEGVVAVTLHRARTRLQKELADWRTV